MEGCHPQVGFVPCTLVFEAGDLIFAIAAFQTFCNVLRKFQGSATFGSWNMTLFTRSCHGPNGRFTLSCAVSVLGTELMPYVVNSTSFVSKNVIRCYNRVNFKVKVSLGQSCFIDLRSNFQLDLRRSKSICLDASWRETHDGAWIIPLSFLVPKLFAKKYCKS